ncbi:MAG TPA: hypothetical protein VMV18_04520, partial [bacterium]|nr:hypothetical protein [bacterium]
PTGTPWRHTIAIDGTDDFSAADEKFNTTSANYFGYVTWDASNLYIAVQGADVSSGNANKFFVAYFGGTGGTTNGVTFATQTPTLPFNAKWEVQWGANNVNSTFANVWTGAAWVNTAWNFTGHVFANTTTGYVEMSIPLSRIGSPAHVPVVMCMLNQTGGVEATYSGVPHDAFTDGFDPNFAHYFDFDFTAATPPNTTVEQ